MIKILLCGILISVFALIIFLNQVENITYVNAQSSGLRINWAEICRSPLVDAVVAEPCNKLVSPDGYQLTEEGNRVLVCLVGGGVGKLYGLSDAQLKSLSLIARCGANNFTSAGGNEECGSVIQRDFTLTADLNCQVDGLIVGGDNLVIELNNHSINGPGPTSEKVGISVPHSNSVIIKGPGTIQNFQAGVLISGSQNTEVSRITFEGNKIAVFMTGSIGSIVEQNLIHSNAIGIASHSSLGAQILANAIFDNQLAGVTLVNTDSFRFDVNSIGGSRNGIYLDSQSSKNTILNNTVLKNDIDLNNADGLPFNINGNEALKNKCIVSNPSGWCNSQ